MEMDRDTARKRIWQAMLAHDGNRDAAATALEVSIRTFYRYLDKYQMHELLEKSGWVYKKGPPRKVEKSSVMDAVVMTAIGKSDGSLDIGKLTKLVHGEDTPLKREGIFSILERLAEAGKIRITPTGQFHVGK